MRKTLIIVMAMLISASALYATANIGLNPWHGGFGVDMASTDYNFASSGLEYKDPGQDTFNDTTTYSDNHMIALGGVWNMESEFSFWGDFVSDDPHIKDKMIITAECENGFYFESISNPGARRPFKLYLLIKESYSAKKDQYSQSGDSGRTRFVDIKELGEGNNKTDYTYSFLTSGNYESWPNTSDKIGHYVGILGPFYYSSDYKFQYMWFDVILCLPYDGTQGANYVTSEGKMTYNNREYTLVEADDYTAIVKLTLSWGGQDKEITIPLRGYYSANITEQDSTASLSVRPRASAANLSIETMQGIEVPVADIDFMATGYPVYNDDGVVSGYNNINSFYMFLSASRNPFESDPNGFRLIRRNRGYSESPYSEDYIGFTVRVSPTAVEGANQNISPVDFDGTKSVPSSGTLSPANKAGMIQIKAETNYETGGENKPVTFTRFQATASIIMDQATTVMNDGIYEEEIYVHIVTDEE